MSKMSFRIASRRLGNALADTFLVAGATPAVGETAALEFVKPAHRDALSASAIVLAAVLGSVLYAAGPVASIPQTAPASSAATAVNDAARPTESACPVMKAVRRLLGEPDHR